MTDGGTDIVTLVRRTLAEVCTVPVLVVPNAISQPISFKSKFHLTQAKTN